MQDACTIDKLKQEIQRLQKTLSDKEDLVLATRRIAADKVLNFLVILASLLVFLTLITFHQSNTWYLTLFTRLYTDAIPSPFLNMYRDMKLLPVSLARTFTLILKM